MNVELRPMLNKYFNRKDASNCRKKEIKYPLVPDDIDQHKLALIYMPLVFRAGYLSNSRLKARIDISSCNRIVEEAMKSQCLAQYQAEIYVVLSEANMPSSKAHNSLVLSFFC